MQIEVTECMLLLGEESFFFQDSIQNIKIKIYRTRVFLLFSWAWNLVKMKKIPPGSHC